MSEPTPPSPRNLRILVIDDNLAIHDDFRKILGGPDAADAALDTAEAMISGAFCPGWFEVDTAAQGEEGWRMISRASMDGKPYAMAFVDMRMPPGWDGIETIHRIWADFPEMQIVLCTAYSDYSWSEICNRIDPGDRLLIVKKPFDGIEIQQLANALTEKWRLSRDSRLHLEGIDAVVEERTMELKASRREALRLMEEAVGHRRAAEHSYAELQREAAERKSVERQLLRAQRMESIGTLAGGIAHDLNNVLAPILMSIDVLKLTVTDESALGLLATIDTSVRRGAEMIGQVLSYARGMDGVRVEVSAADVIRDIENITRETFPRNIAIRTMVPADLWLVQADPTQLHQVLLNLCVNARDAMPDGGAITITAGNLRIGESGVSADIDVPSGSYLAIRVDDEGGGIPPEILEKIFDPFFTTKDIGKGTGLGLSTSLAIVRGHGGSLVVRQAPGGGASFQVFLPAAPFADAGMPAALEQRPVLPPLPVPSLLHRENRPDPLVPS